MLPLQTTLAKALADLMGLPVHYEPTTDNVYLADFYKDIGKYSFAMQVCVHSWDFGRSLPRPRSPSATLQVYLLNKRFLQQQQIIWSGLGGVQDRTIYEDSVFARVRESACQAQLVLLTALPRLRRCFVMRVTWMLVITTRTSACSTTW